MKKTKILKQASILTIAAILILSTSVAIANTEPNPVLTKNIEKSEPETNPTFELTNVGDLLWDNGMANDPASGWSNFDAQYAGGNRSLMDDFEVPSGEEWRINELQILTVWNTQEPGHGTDFVLSFWSDNDSGPGPGSLIETVSTISYGETKTGGVLFGRNTTVHTYQFSTVAFTEGTYWIDGRTVVGMDNNFWFVNDEANITGSECWLNWEYDGYFGNGSGQIGYPSDLLFALYYNETLEPPVFEVEIGGGIGVTATIANIGLGNATNVNGTIEVEGGIILIGGEKSFNFPNIAAETSEKAKSFVLGFGKATITVGVKCDEGASAQVNASKLVLLFLVL